MVLEEEVGAVELALSVREVGDAAVLEVVGEIDIYSAPQLRQALVDLVASGRSRIIVDLEQVGFLDSTGLGVLVGGLKRARAQEGYLRLVTAQERLIRIFRITGLTKVFDIYETVEAATH